MIVSFGDDATADLYHGRTNHRVRRFPSAIIKPVLCKLDMLNASDRLIDLREPPGDRLEASKGDLAEHYSENCVAVFSGIGDNASILDEFTKCV